VVDNISGNNGNSGDSRNVNNANMINGTGKSAGNARSGRRKDFYGKRNGSDQMANKGGYLNKNGSGKDNYSNYSKDNKSGLKDGKLGRESAKKKEAVSEETVACHTGIQAGENLRKLWKISSWILRE